MRLLGLWVAVSGALFAWSELIFLNEGPVRAVLAPDGPRHFAELWAFYLIPGAAWLALARLSWPARWWQAVLAGGLVGFAIEGAMVPAVYEAPPLSFLWTSLSWHAPVDVMLGLWLLPLLLARDGRLLTLVATLAITGAAAGLWALWTVGGHLDALNLDPGAYGLVLIVSLPMAAFGAWAWAAWGPDAVAGIPPRLAKGVLWVVGALGVVMGFSAPVWLPAFALFVLGWGWLWNRVPRESPVNRPPAPTRVLAFTIFGVVAWISYVVARAAFPEGEVEFITFLAFSTGTFVVLFAVWKGFTAR